MIAAEVRRGAPASASRVEELGIDPRDVVAFPEGLPGFEACRGFVVLTSEHTAPVQRLLSVEGPEASFLAIDPKVALPEYRCRLGKADLARLAADADVPLLWLALVAVEADGSVTANLRAPIVINPARMVGYQVAPHDCVYPLRFPLVSAE